MIFLSWSVSEFTRKVESVRQLLAEEQLEGILITAQTNFFWLTGGRPYINTTSEKACADLLVTKEKVYLLANNIEGHRLATEELAGLAIEVVTYAWWEPQGLHNKIKECVGNGLVKSDGNLGVSFARLRWTLTADEQGRFKDTGTCVGKILGEVAHEIKPGDTELEIAGMMKRAAFSYGVNANVALVAVDERTKLYRHPLPTGKKLDKYAMLVISGEKHGLYASASRLVHFGQVSADLEKRFQAVVQVDAAYLGATTAGNQLNTIFQAGIDTYASTGFPGEWTYHHQGGMAGYASREIKSDLITTEQVTLGQAYAWNPTIAGVKSEDTFILGNDGLEMITGTPNFPVVTVENKGFSIKRSGILIR